MPTLFTKTFALLNNIKPPPVTAEITAAAAAAAAEETIKPLEQATIIELKEPSSPTLSIWKAAEQNNIEALQYHIDHAPLDTATLLNTRDPDTDCTLLHLLIANAATTQILPALNLLLKHGADATARNIYNVQAIHMVSLHCTDPLSAMEQLLTYHANPNAPDGDGWTPLHYAARFCRTPKPVLQLLIQRGAQVNLTDVGHKAPIFGLLANQDLVSEFEYLIQAKADLTIRGDFLDSVSRATRPGTVVLQAIKYRRLNCLEYLIKSSVAMQQLRQVLDRDELSYATRMVKEQQLRMTSEQEVAKTELLLQLLQELEDQLERDPLSLISMNDNQPSAVMSKSTHTVQQRNPSFVNTVLDHMRHKSSIQRKSSVPNKLFRKMSRMLQRSKSDGSGMNAIPPQQEEEALYIAPNHLSHQ